MKTKKKNRFLTFCFSLIPGAGEMYMGFLKNGVSLMMLFFLTIIIATAIGQGVLAVFSVVIWFYGFFHANHLASLTDEEFREVEDEYLFGMQEVPGVKTFVEKYHSCVAAILIFVGVCFLWSTIASLLGNILPGQLSFIAEYMWRIGDFVPSIIIGGVIIFMGIKMIRGKEFPLADTEKNEEKQADQEEK